MQVHFSCCGARAAPDGYNGAHIVLLLLLLATQCVEQIVLLHAAHIDAHTATVHQLLAVDHHRGLVQRLRGICAEVHCGVAIVAVNQY